MTAVARAPSRTRRNAKRSEPRFCVCLSNAGHPASLEIRKIYRRLRDIDAEAEGLLRVVDESGEAYLYPRTSFADVSVEPKVARALVRAG